MPTRATIVLLPGLDGTGDLLDDLTKALQTRLSPEVLCYPPDRALDYPALVEWVRARLPPDRAFLLLAESFSGPIGIALAATPTPGLCGLILCCSFARNPRRGLRWLAPLVGLVPIRRVPATLLSPFVFGRHGTPARRSALSQALAKVENHVLTTRLQQVMRIDHHALLARIVIPVLDLRAADDRLVPLRAKLPLQNQIAHLQQRRLPGPHFLLQVQAQQAAAEIIRFAEQCAGQGNEAIR